MNRRSFIKKSVGSLLTLAGIGGGTFYYVREIEPGMLNIQEENISSSTIPTSFQNFKIVQFSDTHVGFHYTVEQLQDIVATINSLEPDVLVFTGDLVDDPRHFNKYGALTKTLSSAKAAYGKYWIYGNHDHGGYGTETTKKVMNEAGFTLLQNSHMIIEKETDRIVLAGIDDVILGKPDLHTALNRVNPDLFTILLAHEPDYADTASQFPVNVQLSGHSHGGQIRLPVIGDLYTPLYAEKYIKGKYTSKNQQFTLYVNSGIGTTRLPYRFLCQPEIHVFTLKTN